MMRTGSIVLASVVLASAVAGANDDVSPAALRVAAQKGLDLLEKTSPTFIKKGGCNSCHSQMLPAAAQAFARSRGITTGETLAQLPPEVSEATAERYVEYAIGGGGGVAPLRFGVFARGLAHHPGAARARATMYFL